MNTSCGYDTFYEYRILSERSDVYILTSGLFSLSSEGLRSSVDGFSWGTGALPSKSGLGRWDSTSRGRAGKKNVERDGSEGRGLDVSLFWFCVCCRSLFLAFVVFSQGVFGAFPCLTFHPTFVHFFWQPFPHCLTHILFLIFCFLSSMLFC